jgi:hypothetical protein
MNLLYKKYNLIYLLSLLLFSNFVIADHCPSAKIVKERNISREYDWSIDERRSLEDVLSVEKLYSVRIKNKGEFIACYYSGEKSLLRLDGAPIGKDCLIKKQSGNWLEAENNEQVCQEDDLNLCVYEINCSDDVESDDG